MDPLGLCGNAWWEVWCGAGQVASDIYHGFSGVLGGKSGPQACSVVPGDLLDRGICASGGLFGVGLELLGGDEGSATEVGGDYCSLAPDGMSLAEEIGILHEAATGHGDFGLGSATVAQADYLGKEWVGENPTSKDGGNILISEDGLHQYRAPSYKPGLGVTQANFESRATPSGEWLSNGHLNINPG